mgnify:CR=1 FL=1
MSDKAKQRFVLDKEKLPFLEIYAGWNGKIDISPAMQHCHLANQQNIFSFLIFLKKNC